MLAAKVDKILRHLWLTAEMDVQVCGQHILGPEPLQVHFAGGRAGDAIGTVRRWAARLIERVVKAVSAYRRPGRAEWRVLQKRRLSVAKLLQALGHAGATGNEPGLGMALPVLIDEPLT